MSSKKGDKLQAGEKWSSGSSRSLRRPAEDFEPLLIKVEKFFADLTQHPEFALRLRRKQLSLKEEIIAIVSKYVTVPRGRKENPKNAEAWKLYQTGCKLGEILKRLEPGFESMSAWERYCIKRRYSQSILRRKRRVTTQNEDHPQ